MAIMVFWLMRETKWICRCDNQTLDNKKFANKLGINGRKDVINNHTWDKHVDKFMDSYKASKPIVLGKNQSI